MVLLSRESSTRNQSLSILYKWPFSEPSHPEAQSLPCSGHEKALKSVRVLFGRR